MLLIASPLNLEGRCVSQAQEARMNVKGTQHRRPCFLIALAVVLLAGMVLSDPALAAKDKPNVLVIWGDDIGISNISAYAMA